MKTIEEALQWLQSEHNAEWCHHYGEPGYQDPEKGILLANWNNVPKNMQTWLEGAGYSLEWSDEWVIDYEHNKAYRCSADSYSWECQFIVGDGGFIFPDDGAAEFIEYLSHDRPNARWGALPSWITEADLEEEGYELFQGGLETGYHPGQTDDPQELAKRAFDAGAERVVFRKTENSQFYTRFECWVLKSEEA